MEPTHSKILSPTPHTPATVQRPFTYEREWWRGPGERRGKVTVIVDEASTLGGQWEAFVEGERLRGAYRIDLTDEEAAARWKKKTEWLDDVLTPFYQGDPPTVTVSEYWDEYGNLQSLDVIDLPPTEYHLVSPGEEATNGKALRDNGTGQDGTLVPAEPRPPADDSVGPGDDV